MRMESPLNQRLRRSPPDVVYIPIDVTSDPDRVEHIGSTAVPGLGAKPIVDMIVGIPFIPQGITRVSMSDHWTETILFRDYLRSNLEMVEVPGSEALSNG